MRITQIKDDDTLYQFIHELPEDNIITKGNIIIDDNHEMLGMNVTEIWDYIIATVGRFTTRHATDIFIDYERFLDICNHVNELEHPYMILGIREHGVDDATQFIGRLPEKINYVTDYYRQILAIEFVQPTSEYNINQWSVILKAYKV